jgi:hypothetical protein
MAMDINLKRLKHLLEAFGGMPQTMKVTHYTLCTQASEVLGMTLRVRPEATATRQRRARPADEDVGW